VNFVPALLTDHSREGGRKGPVAGESPEARAPVLHRISAAGLAAGSHLTAAPIIEAVRGHGAPKFIFPDNSGTFASHLAAGGVTFTVRTRKDAPDGTAGCLSTPWD